MNYQKGFVSAGVLLVIIVVLIVGGGTYYVMQESANPQIPTQQIDVVPSTQTNTLTPAITTGTVAQDARTKAAPTIKVTGFKSSGPATITVSYTNLPMTTGALALCLAEGGCTDWVEQFTPSSPNGSYTMSVQHGFAESQKGIGTGSYVIVVIGSEFSDQVATSNVFTVQDSQSAQTLKTYTNSQYGFSVMYPQDVSYTLTNPARLSNGSVSFSLGSSKTGSGRLDMGFPLPSEYCNVPKTDASHAAPTDLRTESIGGITFSVYTNTSAPPTESFRQRIYQGLRGNDCYFFSEDIAGGSVLSSEEVAAKLDAIVRSFHFSVQ